MSKFFILMAFLTSCAFINQSSKINTPCLQRCAQELGLPETELLTTRDREGFCVCAEVVRVLPDQTVEATTTNIRIR